MCSIGKFHYVFIWKLILIIGQSSWARQQPTDSQVTVYMPGWSFSPKISLLSHQMIGDTIDVPKESTIHLRCTGQKPLTWSFPVNNQPYASFEQSANMSLTHHCNEDHEVLRQCISEVIIYDAQYDMTGYYTCQYSNYSSGHFSPSNGEWMDSIYIFVNDPENLVVPYESVKAFFFMAVFQSHPATIPCRPSYSQAEVTLWKAHTKDNVPEQIKVNASLGIRYDPKKGFHLDHPRWDSDTNMLECRFRLGEIEEKSIISLHWSILPAELHPFIDDSQAKHIFINDTFTLRCFVHIEIGVIIVVDWDYPNKNNSGNRIFKSNPETIRELVNHNSYDTVSINITVVNATADDQGIYRCNATDGHGRTFSAIKKIIIFDENLSPTIDFITDFDSNVPVISEFGHDVYLRITANAFPDISFVELTWYKDDQPLFLNDSHYQVNVATENQTQILFFINSARPSDSGIYRLTGSTPNTSSNVSMAVYIKGEQEITIDETLDFYVLNRTYELICKSYGYPSTEVWWSWLACTSPQACLDLEFVNETEWINITTTVLHENRARALIYSNETRPYLSVSHLLVQAKISGIYRCSSILWDGFHSTNKQQAMSFIVMDGEELFAITSSTDEPTVNDTITLTCRVSLFRYTAIQWIRSIDGIPHQVNGSESINQYSISSTIMLPLIGLNDSSMFTCQAVPRSDPNRTETKDFYLNVQNVSMPTIVESNLNQEIIEADYNSQTELKCFIEGRPRPSIRWFHNGVPLSFDGHDSGLRLHEQGQRLVFTRLLDKDSGLYECRISNRGGTIVRKVFLQVKGNVEDFPLPTSEILLITLCFVMGTVIIITAFLFGKRFRDEKINKRELEFFSKTLFEQGQMQLFNPEMPLDEQIDLLPYDSRFEFPKERLILGRTLGQGAFGRVVKAEAIGLENDESITTVAVKMLKERADTNQRKALMAELKILIHLGKHLNIVNLLGAVTKNLVKGELLVIVEYCEFGNLRHYLLANRDFFVNQLSPLTGGIDQSINDRDPIAAYQNVVDIVGKSAEYFVPNGAMSYVDLFHRQNSKNSTSSNGSSEYINTNATITDLPISYFNSNYVGSGPKVPSRSSRFRRQTSVSQRRQSRLVTTTDLICWAFQCARGMDYLTMRKLIHRDLAARNVLLASNNVVKICDFGLAKDVYKYDNYIKKDDGPLPIKWMAIESISDKVFTSKSDVWSYGILLWELFTLGKNPYPGLEIDEEFYKRLKNGYRMEKPDYASEDLYQLMLQCWNADPNDRPDFSEIADIVGQFLDDKTKKHYIELNNPYLEMNQQILGSNDYLKMTCMTTGGPDLVSDESQYETNIAFLRNECEKEAASSSEQKIETNAMEMAILDRSMTAKSRDGPMHHNDACSLYDNLTPIL